jgi:hypothetical protein
MQSAGLLITVVLNPNVDDVSAERSTQVGDVDAALDVVRSFLVGFAQEVAS